MQLATQIENPDTTHSPVQGHMQVVKEQQLQLGKEAFIHENERIPSQRMDESTK